ncbi:MAG: Trp family transcriptional regulator [bacterium]|nr:Trp family transcriptional regulator [bacterium]
MPKISKYKLEKEIYDSISRELRDIFAETKDKKDIENFLNDLLTPTEKIMLAKRLAIVIMLERMYPFRVISKTLKVSEATIGTVKERLDRNGSGFEVVFAYLDRKKPSEIYRKINKIVRLFAMPPYAGRGRWKFLDGIEE